MAGSGNETLVGCGITNRGLMSKVSKWIFIPMSTFGNSLGMTLKENSQANNFAIEYKTDKGQKYGFSVQRALAVLNSLFILVINCLCAGGELTMQRFLRQITLYLSTKLVILFV